MGASVGGGGSASIRDGDRHNEHCHRNRLHTHRLYEGGDWHERSGYWSPMTFLSPDGGPCRLFIAGEPILIPESPNIFRRIAIAVQDYLLLLVMTMENGRSTISSPLLRPHRRHNPLQGIPPAQPTPHSYSSNISHPKWYDERFCWQVAHHDRIILLYPWQPSLLLQTLSSSTYGRKFAHEIN